MTDGGRWDLGSSHRLTESLLDLLVLIILPEARGLVSVHRVPHKEEEIDPMCHRDPVNSSLKLVVVVGVRWGGIKFLFSSYENQSVWGLDENTCSQVRASRANHRNGVVCILKEPA